MCVGSVVSARGTTDQIDTASDLDSLGQSRAFCLLSFGPCVAVDTYVDHVCTVQEFTPLRATTAAIYVFGHFAQVHVPGVGGGDLRQSI